MIASLILAAGILLQGEGMTNAPITCAPFPDRVSAYVFRNWFVVPHERLAKVVDADESALENMAVEMGLPRKVEILPQWHRQGYITVLRRNWHLLNYPQLLKLLDMSRDELRTRLKEDDFLWTKLGKIKPNCAELKYDAEGAANCREKRLAIGKIMKLEGIDDFREEPRFKFVEDIKQINDDCRKNVKPGDSPFEMRLVFSYFADYCDPLWDEEISSYPEGLLQKLSAQGVNAIWLHTVLNMLAKDPKYPEFGIGSERRIANLNKLVARAKKYGIKVYIYMNEPRAQSAAFFEVNDERRSMRGSAQAKNFEWAMCTSHPETRRWMRDSLRQVFENAPGLGGIFTITMSENLTNCGAKFNKDECPRCRKRSYAELIAEQNNTLIEGMLAGNPEAEALVWDWSWPVDARDEILKMLPKKHCRVQTVSEGRMKVSRGGALITTHDYSISCVGPSEKSLEFWHSAQTNGLKTAAKVQVGTTWEMSSVPYLPVMDLVAEHASNLVRAGIDGVMLSWSLGCAPSPNLKVYDLIGKDANRERVLDKIAVERYGSRARGKVRQAWTEFSEGFRNFPFDIEVVYYGPMQLGPTAPIFVEPTGYMATMVGFPYDMTEFWFGPYAEDAWIRQMQLVAEGFDRGDAAWKSAIGEMSGEQRAIAEKERGIFRAAGLHFASSADLARFYKARRRGDRQVMKEILKRELERAKEELELVRNDSRIGYESSNHYFFIPQDLREKILSCRLLLGDF